MMNYKLFFLLFSLGLPGIIAMTVFAITAPPPGLELSVWAVRGISALQSAAFLMLSLFVGLRYGSKVGLTSPVLEKLSTNQPFTQIFSKSFFIETIAISTAVSMLLFVHKLLATDELLIASKIIDIPLLAKILYGGITEEILIRFGVMGGLSYFIYKTLNKKIEESIKVSIIISILLSSFLFGAAHLPIVESAVGLMSFETIFLIITTNSMAGILFGILFWRRGLEAAILAHITAHLLYALLNIGF